MKNVAIGVDIGGSHITCQLFDPEKNRLIEGTKVRVPVDSSGSKEEILGSWTDAIKQAASGRDLKKLAGIGFAMPGPFDYRNGIALFDEEVNKFGDLYGVDVKNELLRMLDLPPDFPVRFLNDASSFAVGEANTEPASDHNRIIALTIGTGFGSTFILDGLPVKGRDGAPEDGFLYNKPFKNSIADDYFSTRWFLGEYKKLRGEEASEVKELVECSENDEDVRELFNIFGKNLGGFLAPWIKGFRAGCIVLGGNISKSYLLFEKEMKARFEEHGIDIPVYRSSLDEDAALTGSAKLCDNDFYSKLISFL